MTTDYNRIARRLRNAVEPVAAGVYFASEAHAEYTALGFHAGCAAWQHIASQQWAESTCEINPGLSWSRLVVRGGRHNEQ
jgi:hypothetical protein